MPNPAPRGNQNRKYWNPLISGPGWFEWWKKLAVENLVGLSLKTSLWNWFTKRQKLASVQCCSFVFLFAVQLQYITTQTRHIPLLLPQPSQARFLWYSDFSGNSDFRKFLHTLTVSSETANRLSYFVVTASLWFLKCCHEYNLLLFIVMLILPSYN